MKSIIITVIISVLFLSSCEMSLDDTNKTYDVDPISSSVTQLKTSKDASIKFRKELEKQIKKYQKELEKRERKRQADELGITIEALATLPEEPPLPEDELIEGVDDQLVQDFVQDIKPASIQYLTDIGVSSSGGTDEQIVFSSVIGDFFDDLNSYNYDFVLDETTNVWNYIPPADNPGNDPFIDVLNACCRESMATVGYVWGGALSAAGAVGLRMGFRAIKGIIINIMGGSTFAALGPITAGWLVWNVVWCLGREYLTE